MAKKSWKAWLDTVTCFRARWSVIFCSFGTTLFVVGVIVTSIGFASKWDEDHHSTKSRALCVTGPVMIGCGFLPLILACIFWTYVKPHNYNNYGNRLQTSNQGSPESNFSSSPRNGFVSDKESPDIDAGSIQPLVATKANKHQQILPESFINSQKHMSQVLQLSITPSSENSIKSAIPSADVSQNHSKHQCENQAHNPKYQSILKNNWNASEFILRQQRKFNQNPGKHISLPQPLPDRQQSSTSSDQSSRPVVNPFVQKLQIEDKQPRRVSFDDVDVVYFTEGSDIPRRNRRKISRTGGNYLTIY